MTVKNRTPDKSIIITDLELRLLSINRSALDLFDLTEGYLAEMTIHDLLINYGLKPDELTIALDLDDNQENYSFRFDMVLESSEKNLDIEIEVLYNFAGKKTGYSMRLAEVFKPDMVNKIKNTALSEHNRFVTVMDSLNAIVYVTDMNTDEILFTNKKVRDIFGDVIGQTCWKVLQTEQTGPCSFCTNHKLLDSTGKPVESIVWEFQNTNDERWYQCKDQAIIWPDGRLVRIEIATDITERKMAEDDLRLEKRRLNDILTATNVGTWEWNIQTGELVLNQRWVEMLGYTLEELSPISINTWSEFAHPEDLLKANELLKKHFNQTLEYYDCEVRMKHRNGNWVWVLDRGKVLSWSTEGKPLLMYGTHLEITNRKNTEISLRRSEEKSFALLNATTDIALLIDKSGLIISANTAAAEYFNSTPQDLLGKLPFNFDFDPAVKNFRLKKLREVVSSKKPARFDDVSGTSFFNTSLYPILDNSGEVSLIALFARDVSRKMLDINKIEMREKYLTGLNKSAQILLRFTFQIPFQEFLDCIGPAANASRTYLFMNHTGVNGESLMSQKAEWCAEGIPPEIDNLVLQNLSYDQWLPRWMDILEKGELVNGRVADFPESERAVLEPQGILAILIIPILIEGDFVGFMGYDNCISDREWDSVEQTFLRTAANNLAQAIRRSKAEATVRSSLKEKELLLREIHHRVKNNMQVVTSLLNLQARKMTEGEALDAIRESQRRISTISQVHEALYLSNDLSRISMDKYLTGVLSQIVSLYLDSEDKNTVRWSVNASNITLPITDAIPVGLIANELVTNAFKHAFPDEQLGFVRIFMREASNGMIELIVADDGGGILTSTDLNSAKTLGLQIVNNLVKVQLGGTITIDSLVGLVFRIMFKPSC